MLVNVQKNVQVECKQSAKYGRNKKLMEITTNNNNI